MIISDHSAGLMLRPMLYVLLAVLLNGCADSTQLKKQAVEQVATPFAASAITLNLTANPRLNMWNDMANSCTVLIIQAEDNSTLEKILNDPMQLKGLFNGVGMMDKIIQVDRYAVMPGQKSTLHIDRAENTRNIAVIAGYYPFPSKQHMTRFTIPIVTSSHGLIRPRWQAELTRLVASITLGSEGLLRVSTSSDDSTRENSGQPNQKDAG